MAGPWVLVGIFAAAIFASHRSKQSMCRYTLPPKINQKFDLNQIFTPDRLWPP
jgi:hypothetical protein